MNLLIFIVMVIGSFLLVRIAAIAFEITGLEWTLAKFQALSCFTTTGYTTKESELVTRYPKRRKIASILMLLGHAGLIALIATFANAMRRTAGEPVFFPALRLVVMAIAIYICYFFFIKTKLAEKLNDMLRRKLSKGLVVESCRQLLLATAGYEITSATLSEGDPVTNKTLREAGLGDRDITVLAVERGADSIVNPPVDTKMLPGDTLICFGKVGNVKKEILKN